MEIERKWFVDGWLDKTPDRVLFMEQGYISNEPVIRIRESKEIGRDTKYILCFKGKGELVRKEIETEISQELFLQLKDFIGKPMIVKEQRRYNLADNLILEVNRVDKGLSSEFYYAEIEFQTEFLAKEWTAKGELCDYLYNEVTYEKGVSMEHYWKTTR